MEGREREQTKSEQRVGFMDAIASCNANLILMTPKLVKRVKARYEYMHIILGYGTQRAQQQDCVTRDHISST